MIKATREIKKIRLVIVHDFLQLHLVVKWECFQGESPAKETCHSKKYRQRKSANNWEKEDCDLCDFARFPTF